VSIFHLALAQLRCDSKEGNLKRINDTIKQASEKGADYILFPELFTTGYIVDGKIKNLADPIHGDNLKQVQASAKNHNIGVILGFPEYEAGNIYNSAVFINKTGEIIKTYRKIHLYDEEKNVFTPGEESPIIDLPEGKVGIMITYDMEFPELARVLALKGAQMIFILCANMIPYQLHQHVYLRARALENHIFIAATNKVGLENENVFFGESEIIHPTGTTLYKSGNNEDIAVIQIDLSDSKKAQGLLNYLNNRRPEIYFKEGLNDTMSEV
jgi:predicted amidohydrolase